MQTKLAEVSEDSELYDKLLTKIDKKILKVQRFSDEFERSISAITPHGDANNSESVSSRILPTVVEFDEPYLLSLNDPASVSSVVIFTLPANGVTRIGTKESLVPQNLLLDDYPGIEPDHALIEQSNGIYTLHPYAPLCFVNGHHVSEPVMLRQGEFYLIVV